jgi:hypothetical protein
MTTELCNTDNTDMPKIVYELMDLYPQGGTDRPSVLYVPLPRVSEERRQAPKSPTPAKDK